jgi:hypothetical protein
VLFQDHLSPDMVIVGFDLTTEQVRDEGWWFLIAEHPGAPRFGLASPPVQASPTRETLAWGNLPMRLDPAGTAAAGFLNATAPADITDSDAAGGSSHWGGDSATTAHVLLIDPFRAAFEGIKMLEPEAGGP